MKRETIGHEKKKIVLTVHKDYIVCIALIKSRISLFRTFNIKVQIFMYPD